jgi:hypothetical protein
MYCSGREPVEFLGLGKLCQTYERAPILFYRISQLHFEMKQPLQKLPIVHLQFSGTDSMAKRMFLDKFGQVG